MPFKSQNIVFSQTEPERLDRFIFSQFPFLSRNYIQGLIQEGTILVNQIQAKKSFVLRKGDQILVNSFLFPEERKIKPNSNISYSIIYHSKEFLIIEKPHHLPTHPNDFLDEQTLANGLISKFPQIQEVGDNPLRPGIVHRLDTDTSGLMIVALTQNIFSLFQELFQKRKIHKTYLALVQGRIEKSGKITTPLAHHVSNPRKMVAVEGFQAFRSNLREATTLYEPLENFSDYTLIKVRTLTGRMHQIRVHLSSKGYPLAGDVLYQNSSQRLQDKFLKLSRHFLHATKLEFSFPGLKEPFCFESPLPKDLEGVLSLLRKK